MSSHNESKIQRELRTWLEDNWDPDVSLIEWRNKLADSGWGVPDWPERWFGRGLPVSMN